MTAIVIRKDAYRALDENHFSPLMTQLSPRNSVSYMCLKAYDSPPDFLQSIRSLQIGILDSPRKFI